MQHLLFLNLGASEILVIALFILLFFGSKQIPELMKGLGKGMREMKNAMHGLENELKNTMNADDEVTEVRQKTEAPPEISGAEKPGETIPDGSIPRKT